MLTSKLPNIGNSIFTVMSAMSQQYGAINLSQGFPNFATSTLLQQLVTDAMAQGANQYAPMAGLPALRQTIAQKMYETQGVHVNPDTEITITSGGTQAIFTIMAAVVQPGDEVILVEPCYDSYRPSLEIFGGKAVVLRLAPPYFQIDWDAMRSLITPRTRMICINTPNNPTGRIMTSNDYQILAEIVANTNILLFSDEVYEHITFDDNQHKTALAYETLRTRTFCIYSFGKTLHCTGWKLGYCVAAPALTQEFRKIHQFNVFSANHPMQVAMAQYLQISEHYSNLPLFYQQKRDYFKGLVANSRFKLLPCEGTYFLLADYSDISQERDFAFCQSLIQTHGVAAIPLSALYSEYKNEKVIRFCFAKTDETLSAAGEKLIQV